MPHAIVIHSLIEGIGGAEKVGLYTARALADLGYKVTLVTHARAGLEPLARDIGMDLATARILDPGTSLVEETVYKLLGGRAAEYRRLIAARRALVLLETLDYDLSIESQSNIPFPADIAYIHFPVLARRLVYGAGGPLRRFYDWLSRKQAVGVSWPRQAQLLAVNSEWTRGLVRRVYGRPACVLHPPVETRATPRDKENIAVTVSRFTPEKKLESILSIAPSLRGLDLKLIVLGSVHGRSSRRYFEELRRKSSSLESIELIANPPREEVEDNLARARFYIHPPFIEHFGIAVAEAAQLGAIPLVYRDGGAWTDIASKIDGRLGYGNIGEVPSILSSIVSTPGLEERLREKSMRVGNTFRYSVFRGRLASLVELLGNTCPEQ
ncbi:MAG: glycosyltransferase [Desulfurococcales archaeon]|nr:glycosyltransferase [Desulfurococcales archaeon]